MKSIQPPIKPVNRTIHYDRKRQRVWLAGRRVHHGLTGIVLALLGCALMVHDWKDRADWLALRDEAL